MRELYEALYIGYRSRAFCACGGRARAVWYFCSKFVFQHERHTTSENIYFHVNHCLHTSNAVGPVKHEGEAVAKGVEGPQFFVCSQSGNAVV